jgi:hypothetical protein
MLTGSPDNRDTSDTTGSALLPEFPATRTSPAAPLIREGGAPSALGPDVRVVLGVALW